MQSKKIHHLLVYHMEVLGLSHHHQEIDGYFLYLFLYFLIALFVLVEVDTELLCNSYTTEALYHHRLEIHM